MQRQTDEQQTQIKQISITRSYLLKSLSSAKKIQMHLRSKIKFWSSPGFSLQCRRLLKNWMCKFASGAFIYSRYLCLWKVYFHLDLLKVGLFTYDMTRNLSIPFPNYYVSGDLERPKSFEKAWGKVCNGANFKGKTLTIIKTPITGFTLRKCWW